MIEFKFSCPHCGTHIQCDVAYTGSQISCPACRRSLVVPPPGMAAPPAPAFGRARGGRTTTFQPQPPPPAAPQYAPEEERSRSVLALLSLILSVLGIPAIICGHIALSQIKRDPRMGGRGLALAGLIIGYLSLALTVGVVAKMTLAGRGAASNNVEGKASQPAEQSTGNIPNAFTVWNETFESGLGKWESVPGAAGAPGATALTDDNTHPHSGSHCAKVSSTSDKMYRDIDQKLNGHSKVTFWIYDSTQTRAFGEVRSYSDGGYGKGTVLQGFSIGRYDIGFGTTGTGTLANEAVDKRKYQGRVLKGANQGWFNLDAPGAPSRSSGWHKFEIERAADGTTINFFVDGVLGRSIPECGPAPWDTVSIGSLGSGNGEGEAWFDDVKLECGGSTVSRK